MFCPPPCLSLSVLCSNTTVWTEKRTEALTLLLKIPWVLMKCRHTQSEKAPVILYKQPDGWVGGRGGGWTTFGLFSSPTFNWAADRTSYKVYTKGPRFTTSPTYGVSRLSRCPSHFFRKSCFIIPTYDSKQASFCTGAEQTNGRQPVPYA